MFKLFYKIDKLFELGLEGYKKYLSQQQSYLDKAVNDLLHLLEFKGNVDIDFLKSCLEDRRKVKTTISFIANNEASCHQLIAINKKAEDKLKLDNSFGYELKAISNMVGDKVIKREDV